MYSSPSPPEPQVEAPTSSTKINLWLIVSYDKIGWATRDHVESLCLVAYLLELQMQV